MKARPNIAEHQAIIDAAKKGDVTHVSIGLCHHSVQQNSRSGKKELPEFVLAWRYGDGSGGSIPCTNHWVAEEMKELLLKGKSVGDGAA